MRIAPECRQCLQGLARQAAEIATTEAPLRAKALQEGLRIVDENFSPENTTVVIAAKIHQAVKEITGNPDPYKEMKEAERKVSQELYNEVSSNYGHDLRGCLSLAALGNAVDFFKDLNTIKDEMRKPIKFVRDEVDIFEKRLGAAGKILYLADNAGEVFFDLPLVKYLRRYGKVIFAVKELPVQNDTTIEDLRICKLDRELEPVITTGTATPGVDLSQASTEFKKEFSSADLVLAKGMGYYETLSELHPEGKVFYCFRAKCNPVARSLGVPLDSYIAMLR